MAKMRAVEVKKAGGDLELVERDVSKPTAGKVKVVAETECDI